MRPTSSGIFTVLGVLLTYLFAAGAFVSTGLHDENVLARAIQPFRELDSKSVLCLVALAFTFAFAFFFSFSASRGSDPMVGTRRVMEFAFVLNAALVALLLALLLSYGVGWIREDALTAQTVGALAAVSLLEIGFGLGLTVLLFFVVKRQSSNRFVFSILAVQLAEFGLLGTVFLLGLNH